MRMKYVCAYLKYDLELSIFVAIDMNRFHITEGCFTLSNGSEGNILLVHLLVQMTFVSIYLTVFSTLPVKHRQIVNSDAAIICFRCCYIYLL